MIAENKTSEPRGRVEWLANDRIGTASLTG
jgi:hypothetical protein